MAARAIWSGSIAFGLVNIPVRLFTATSSHRIEMHMFQKGTGQRIRFKRVAEKSGREVAYEDIVRGVETGKGRYVMLEPEELDAAEPKKTRAIQIEDFVDLDAIDPITFDATYFVGPDERSERAYLLFRKAMEEMGKVGVGRFVMREKEHLVTLRPFGDRGLALETMYFADEIRDPRELEAFPGKAAALPAKEVELAKQLVTALSSDWDPKKYRDTYRDAVAELVKRKARGEEIEVEAAKDEPAQVVDLMDALKKSLAAGSGKGETRRAAPARRKPRRAAAATAKRGRTKRGSRRAA